MNFEPALRGAILAACAMACQPAFAQEFCDPIPPGETNACAADEYGTTPKSDPCSTGQNTKGTKVCLPWNEPPQPTFLECWPRLRGFRCSAWPKSADGEDPLTYVWEGSGRIYAGSSAPTHSDIRDVTCMPPGPNNIGFVTVTITSPFGLSSSLSIGIDCSSNQHQ